jgi:hypothetical protein
MRAAAAALVLLLLAGAADAFIASTQTLLAGRARVVAVGAGARGSSGMVMKWDGVSAPKKNEKVRLHRMGE